MQRIGVFVCHCGTNIAGTVDVKSVAEALKTEPGVVFSTDYQYMCSQAGQEMIINAVKDNNLTGIVVCSCSPRMHEATFRKTAAKAGINPYMVEIANIREQCSWVHKDVPTGTQKAIILAKAAVAKVNLNAPLTPAKAPLQSARWLSAEVLPVFRPLLTLRTRDLRLTLLNRNRQSVEKWHSLTKRSPRSTARLVF